MTMYPFHLYGSEEISGTEDKKPNIMTKDDPGAVVTGFGES